MATTPAMQLLERHVPLSLLCDLLAPPSSEELLAREKAQVRPITLSAPEPAGPTLTRLR